MTTTDIKELKSRLLNRELVRLSNEQHCISIGSDDYRSAELTFDAPRPHMQKQFKIWFNGEIIHLSKTFKSFENRLLKLIGKWNLTEEIE
jgi:hypothetical protein